MHVSCYLCGPITGLTYDEAITHREEIAMPLEKRGVEVRSPMRGKRSLSHQYRNKPLPSGHYRAAMSTDSAIFARDHHDVSTVDVIIADFLGATKASIGSMFELAWASHLHKFVVLIMEKEGNPHEHAFVREAASCRVHSREEAVHAVLEFAGLDVEEAG
jgi:nucleoside 2-deoxyribosyltransferase